MADDGMPTPETMLLQARPADGGDWTDIWPAQLPWMAKNGLDVRALSGDELPADADRWQPIETAPKDGTPVDLWCRAPGLNAGPGRVPDCWHSNGKWWRHDLDHGDDLGRARVYNATHWRLIPAPPREAT
jgi:hypothetical protein